MLRQNANDLVDRVNEVIDTREQSKRELIESLNEALNNLYKGAKHMIGLCHLLEEAHNKFEGEDKFHYVCSFDKEYSLEECQDHMDELMDTIFIFNTNQDKFNQVLDGDCLDELLDALDMRWGIELTDLERYRSCFSDCKSQLDIFKITAAASGLVERSDDRMGVSDNGYDSSDDECQTDTAEALVSLSASDDSFFAGIGSNHRRVPARDVVNNDPVQPAHRYDLRSGPR